MEEENEEAKDIQANSGGEPKAEDPDWMAGATRLWRGTHNQQGFMDVRYMPYKNQEDEKRKKHLYYMKHRKRIIARIRRWQKDNPEKAREIKRRFRQSRKDDEAYREKERDRMRRYYKANRQHVRSLQKECRIRNRAKLQERRQSPNQKAKQKAYDRLRFERDMKRCEVDPEFYAKYRIKDRVKNAKRRVRSGKPYKPRVCRRIPDYAVKGQPIINGTSPFLFTGGMDNLSHRLPDTLGTIGYQILSSGCLTNHVNNNQASFFR